MPITMIPKPAQSSPAEGAGGTAAGGALSPPPASTEIEVPAAGGGEETADQRRAAALAILEKGLAEGGGEEGGGETPSAPAPIEAPPKAEAKPQKPAKEPEVTGEKPPEKPAEEPKEPFNERFDKLVKAQAEARKEREALAKEREAFNRERNGPAKAKSALEALKLNGFDPEAVVEEILGDKSVRKGTPPVSPELQKKLSELDEVKAELKTLREERQSAKQAEDRRADFHTIGALIAQGGEKYELLKELGEEAVTEVYERSVGNYNRHGEWIGGSAQTAVDMALQATLERHQRRAEALLQSEWAKRKLGGAGTKPAAVRPKETTGQKPLAVSRTLHNGHAAASPPRAADAHPSTEQLRAEALKVLEEGMRSGQSGS